jgi:hypothetical protein
MSKSKDDNISRRYPCIMTELIDPPFTSVASESEIVFLPKEIYTMLANYIPLHMHHKCIVLPQFYTNAMVHAPYSTTYLILDAIIRNDLEFLTPALINFEQVMTSPHRDKTNKSFAGLLELYWFEAVKYRRFDALKLLYNIYAKEYPYPGYEYIIEVEFANTVGKMTNLYETDQIIRICQRIDDIDSMRDCICRLVYRDNLSILEWMYLNHSKDNPAHNYLYLMLMGQITDVYEFHGYGDFRWFPKQIRDNQKVREFILSKSWEPEIIDLLQQWEIM